MEKLTSEEKKYILDRILDSISYISNKEFQRRVWIRGEGPECDNFGEMVWYYSSLTELVFENYIEYGISDTQLPVMKKFHDAFQKFSEDNDWPQFFIDTPEWTKITELAIEVLQAFNYIREGEADEDKLITLNEYLENIQHVSDEEYQQRMWIYGKCTDFDETICYHFFMTNTIFKEYQHYGITNFQFSHLGEFHTEFEKFLKAHDGPPYLFVKSPEWGKVTEMAKEVLWAFRYKKREATSKLEDSKKQCLVRKQQLEGNLYNIACIPEKKL